ncbi:MAG: patatin-like phospholipase family protein [Chloroflexi bacterium]|nr:patatin-like phospholipase family protein [Chloroflexota bacterium]
MRDRLRQVSLFSSLSDAELDDIASRAHPKHVHKGASVFLAGEPGDSMYVILSGLVKVISEQKDADRFILYLGPGNFFGEGAALFGGNHSASVYVVIDADLLVLTPEDIQALIQRHPQLSLMIIRELHARLRLSLRSPIQTKELTLITVIGDAAPTLAEHLAQISGEDVLLFDLGGMSGHPVNPAVLAQDHVYLTYANDGLSAETLPERLSQLIKQYYWAMLWVSPDETPLTLKALDQADLRVVLGPAYARRGEQLAPRHRLYADDSIAAIHQLARQLARRQVGLALSSGNARGMAHIGVLKVLLEENIPIDMIAGTSAGALFGAMFAAGRSIDELMEFAATVPHEMSFRTGFRNWDLRVPPQSGIIKGDMLLKHLRRLVFDKAFESLKIPLAVITADLITGEEIVFDHGSVADAVRASMSMGGLIEPARTDGRFLIDGGAINPVPTQALADHGMNLIIAVSVIPTLEDRIRRRKMKREQRAPSLVDIWLGEREIMEREIIRSRINPVDVVIQPDVARYSVREYDKAQEIIRSGEDAARLQVPYIRKLLAPRPRKLPQS